MLSIHPQTEENIKYQQRYQKQIRSRSLNVQTGAVFVLTLGGQAACVQRQPGGCGKDKRREKNDRKNVWIYITWDEYFMGVALLSGRRSKDPSTQVGAYCQPGQ